MADLKKGVTIGTQEVDGTVEEKDFPKQETQEQMKEIIRTHEEDFIQGLIDAAQFANDETQRIEIVRDGKLYFAFNIRPLSSEEYDKCRKKHTKYVRNRQLGMKMPEDTNRVKYQSAIIYQATTEEDRAKLWDNRKVWDALNAKYDHIMNGLDVIEATLKAGEKDKILEAIDKLSGYDNDLEEIGTLEDVAKN